MTGVTGQYSIPGGGEVLRAWITTGRGAQIRRDVDPKIARALDEVIEEAAVRHAGVFGAAALVARHGAALALDGRRGRPLRLRRAGEGAALHTRADVDAWTREWAAEVARLCDRAVAYSAEIHARIDRLDFTLPLLGSDGRPLTGLAADSERVRRIADHVDHWDLDDEENLEKRRAALRSTRLDRAAGGLSTDLETARGQLLDRVDDAAAEVRRWLLDDPHDRGAGAANATQEAELRRLEGRRQDGRRQVRQAATIASATSSADGAAALIRGAGVEGAPRFRAPGAAAHLGASLALAWTKPAAGRWSHVLDLVQPPRTVTGTEPTLLGGIALDPVDAPEGWTVSSARRPAPNAHEGTLTIAWAGEGEPDAGAHVLELTARNKLGPRRLAVTVTVPAATGESA